MFDAPGGILLLEKLFIPGFCHSLAGLSLQDTSKGVESCQRCSLSILTFPTAIPGQTPFPDLPHPFPALTIPKKPHPRDLDGLDPPFQRLYGIRGAMGAAQNSRDFGVAVGLTLSPGTQRNLRVPPPNRDRKSRICFIWDLFQGHFNE